MQLLHPKLPQLISDAVLNAGFPLTRVNLEITQAAVFQHQSTALQTAERIRLSGWDLSGMILEEAFPV